MARSKYRLSATMRDATTRAMILLRYPVVTIFDAGTSNPIGQTLYAGATGGTTLPNPFTGDQYGTVEFFLDAAQDVKILVDGAYEGLGTYTIDYEPTPPLVAGLVTTAGGKTIDGTLLIAPSSGTADGGAWVDANGWVGFLDAATGSSLAATNTPFSVVHTSAVPEVMADFQLHTSYPGWVALGTNTADAGGTTTSLVDASIDFSTCNLAHLVNPAISTSVLGAMVEILGGAGYNANDRFRYIQSLTNSNHTINWTRPLGAATDNTTSYRIWQPGDNGAMRVLFEQKNGAVQAGRASEFHAYAQTGAADSGLVTLELSVGTNTPQFDPDNNNGVLSVRASSAWLTGNIGVEQGYGTRYWGELGFRNYWMAQNAAGAFEFKARKGGHQEMTGNLTVGQLTAGTPRLLVKQSSDGSTGGVQIQESAAAIQNAYLFVGANGADPGLYIASVGTAGTTYFRLGSVGAGSDTAARIITNNNSTTGDLFHLELASGNTKFLVNKDGSIGVQGTTSFGGGAGVIGLKNAGTNPSTNPSGGCVIYADAGAAKVRGSGGTVTTFGAAEPHCPICDRDFALEWESARYGRLAVCVWCLTEALGDAGVMEKRAA